MSEGLVVIEDVAQGSQEWLNLRCGRVTASRISDVMARTKTGFGASRANYMSELILERLTGAPTERFTNAAMAHGTATEPEARGVYEFWHGVEVMQVGFVHHPSIAMAGCSPDGLIGDDGLLELKCPTSATHLEALLSQTVPDKYLKQMQFQMCCTGRSYCDYVSYDPRMREDMRMWVTRIPRDNDAIAVIEKEVQAFLIELDGKIAALNALYPLQEAAE